MKNKIHPKDKKPCEICEGKCRRLSEKQKEKREIKKAKQIASCRHWEATKHAEGEPFTCDSCGKKLNWE